MLKQLAIPLCVLLLSPNIASAWGRKGHAAIAALAEKNLTPAAEAQVHELLKNDLDRYGKPSGRTKLSQVASWADEIREIEPTDIYKGWHTRSNQVCSATLGPCKDGHCVDQNIIRYADVLKDRGQSPRARNEALKWVVHLVGDLHQPLHSGVNGHGGFTVTLEGMDTPPGRTI
ncbi:MAG TPA: S1/P1 nuclease, partial [Rhodocyclaceae bacterium]|nr:S1/P1 nuclease [Rhodocyclaceae bacterium]